MMDTVECRSDSEYALEIKLSEEEIKKLEAAYKPHPVLGHS